MQYYILDTNIILDDPYSIYNFKNATVVLTETIINEVNKFKKGNEDRNVNAREFNRQLKDLRKKGNLNEGIEFNKSYIKFEFNHPKQELPNSFSIDIADNSILQVALYYKNQNKDITLITRDTLMSIKADVLNIKIGEYDCNKNALDYTGRSEIYMSNADIEECKKAGKISIDKGFYSASGTINCEFNPNEYLLIHNAENPQCTVLGKVSKNCDYIEFITEQHPYDINAKNVGQKFCIDALMRPTDELPLVIINGGSGTGKDFVTLACGLEQVFNQNLYRKILITREIQTLGKDIGTLPGDEEEKIAPFLRGFIDNLEVLVDNNLKQEKTNEKEIQSKIDYLFDTGVIKAEAVAYMRGRSIYKQFIIIDEAQNLTITQMKGILTRVAKDTKIVILGDVKQIDSPYLTDKTNGLTWAMQLMKDSPYEAQITLNDNESVRSDLVKDILNRL